MSINSRKVVIVGCGFVGSSSAFALMQSKLFSEMVLIDADHDRAGRRSYGYQSWHGICQSHEDLCGFL